MRAPMAAIINQRRLPFYLMQFGVKIFRVGNGRGPFESDTTAGNMRLSIAGAK